MTLGTDLLVCQTQWERRRDSRGAITKMDTVENGKLQILRSEEGWVVILLSFYVVTRLSRALHWAFSYARNLVFDRGATPGSPRNSNCHTGLTVASCDSRPRSVDMKMVAMGRLDGRCSGGGGGGTGKDVDDGKRAMGKCLEVGCC